MAPTCLKQAAEGLSGRRPVRLRHYSIRHYSIRHSSIRHCSIRQGDPAIPDTAEAKQRLREAALARRGLRQADSRDGAMLHARFLEAANDLLAQIPLPAVSGFWPSHGEIDVRPLLHHLAGMGCVCALPVVVGPGEPLVFRRWRPDEALVAGGFGIPVPDSRAPVVVPRLVITPLLAVDPAGNRLGYGRGYYDRTLQALRAAGPVSAIGVCFDSQIVTAVPHDGNDRKLDRLVSEKRVILFDTENTG